VALIPKATCRIFRGGGDVAESIQPLRVNEPVVRVARGIVVRDHDRGRPVIQPRFGARATRFAPFDGAFLGADSASAAVSRLGAINW
jgi:hypothetical protein